VKESDRQDATARLLRDFAVDAVVENDALTIAGGEVLAPNRYRPARDHRMVMAAAALAVGALSRTERGECELLESDEVAVSDPEFFTTLRELSGVN
jgi:5-enolpyruvylshikimate-3-phosphate synthase